MSLHNVRGWLPQPPPIPRGGDPTALLPSGARVIALSPEDALECAGHIAQAAQHVARLRGLLAGHVGSEVVQTLLTHEAMLAAIAQRINAGAQQGEAH